MTSLSPSALGLPPKFRAYHPGQSRAILDLAISDTRFDLVSAPTGSGKTCIMFSVARILGARTLFLVSTKALQDQAFADLSSAGMVDIRGHGNYPCSTKVNKSPISFYDDDLLDAECTAKRDGGDCGYWAQVSAAVAADTVITNYAHWIALAKSGDPDRLGKFDLLVCDEAHLLVSANDVVVSQLSVSLSDRVLRSLLDIPLPSSTSLTIQDWREWASIARDVARARYSDLRSDQMPGSPPTRDMVRITRIGRELSRFILESDPKRGGNEWVSDIGDQGPGSITLSPVWGKPYAESHLFRSIPRVILCSATLAESDAKYLGIVKPTYTYREVPSTFSPARRPLIFVNMAPAIRVDYRMGEGEMRVLIRRVDDLLATRLALNWKIIIQARSYKHARSIYEHSRYRSLMLIHDSSNTSSIIRHFKQAKVGCVLVSPAVEEGHDFIGDQCRCQIIWKVPFIYAKSPLMAARVRHDKSYVNYLAAKAITQQYGRSTRDPGDWSEVIIFDDHWNWFRNTPYFAKWFRAAFREANRIPEPLQVAA